MIRNGIQNIRKEDLIFHMASFEKLLDNNRAFLNILPNDSLV